MVRYALAQNYHDGLGYGWKPFLFPHQSSVRLDGLNPFFLSTAGRPVSYIEMLQAVAKLAPLLADEPDLARELRQYVPQGCHAPGGHVHVVVPE